MEWVIDELTYYSPTSEKRPTLAPRSNGCYKEVAANRKGLTPCLGLEINDCYQEVLGLERSDRY